MKHENEYVIVLDVPGIKKFVFGTDRLVEIRGASSLLDYLNRISTPNFFIEKFGNQSSSCVFAGGGSAQFLIKSTKEEIESSIRSLTALYSRESKGALQLLYGIFRIENGNYQEALSNAHLDLQRRKEQESATGDSMFHTGFMRECDSCSSPASVYSTYGGEVSILCGQCSVKVDAGNDRKKGLWKNFADFLVEKGFDREYAIEARPKDFDAIGKRARTRQGYTALIYADGNSMGHLVRNIKKKEQFQFFSSTVDGAIRESCHEALYEVCCRENCSLPCDILLLGGDDLLVYLTADDALEFAVTVAEKFQEKTKGAFLKYSADNFFKEALGERGLTISIGIAYAKSHTPFSILLTQAEELLKSAKLRGSSDRRTTDFFAPTYIDFHVTPYYRQVKVSDSREQHLTLQNNIKLYRKPYSLEEAKILLRHAKELSQKVPRSRLKRYGYAPLKGLMQGTLETLHLYCGSKSKNHRNTVAEALNDFDCFGNMPWNRDGDQVSTVMVDLIELTEFVTGD